MKRVFRSGESEEVKRVHKHLSVNIKERRPTGGGSQGVLERTEDHRLSQAHQFDGREQAAKEIQHLQVFVTHRPMSTHFKHRKKRLKLPAGLAAATGGRNPAE